MELLQGRRRLHDGAAANAHRTKKTPRGSCCLEWIQCLDGSRGGQGEPTGGAEPEEDATSLAVSQIHFALAPCDALRDG
jgi:hypothetical protein